MIAFLATCCVIGLAMWAFGKFMVPRLWAEMYGVEFVRHLIGDKKADRLLGKGYRP